MREAALCDKHSKLYELERSQENHSFFSEIVANITDVKVCTEMKSLVVFGNVLKKHVSAVFNGWQFHGNKRLYDCKVVGYKNGRKAHINFECTGLFEFKAG